MDNDRPFRQDDAPFTERDLISLGEKLAALELSDPERSALAALISDDDVVGFGRFDIAGAFRLGVRKVQAPGVRADGIRAFGIRKGQVQGSVGDPGKPGGF